MYYKLTEDLSLEKVSLAKHYYLPLIGLFIILLSASLIPPKDTHSHSEDVIVITSSKGEFNEEVFKQLLISSRIKFPDIVYAQARLETNGFTSDIFLENNNLFGMKLAGIRASTAIGENRGHALYKNINDSVFDYAIWQAMYCKNMTRSEYLQFIDKRYAEVPNYVERLNIK